MTPEKQRIAIAEACGWTGPFNQNEWLREYDKEGGDVYAKLAGTDPLDGSRGEIPDYLNDLNAMHEAERALLPFESDRWQGYAVWLAHLTPLGGQDHATAAQRAEAFLRTLDKWEEAT